eukprot:TRINITY_DN1795_c0_g4_i1.p1 TRINITY_DN1795_c0_g4~~TRINITY_DN1795_c0_g4_i1.p1  ORF type:complete len:712 (+),score=148.20 TRINITY_DN1795_c0_g4_i1:42-2177(+)
MSRKKDRSAGAGGGYLAQEEQANKVRELEERLEGTLAAVKSELIQSLKSEVKKINEHVDVVSKKATETAVDSANQETFSQIEKLREEILLQLQSASDRIDVVDAVSKAAAVHTDVLSRLETERSNRKDLGDELRKCIREAADAAQHAAEQKATEEATLCLNELEKHVTQLRKETASVAPPLDARCDALQVLIDSLNSELGKSIADAEEANSQLTELVQSSRRTLEESLADVLFKSEKAREEAFEDVGVLRDAVKQNEQNLREASKLAENVHCRIVTWRCGNFQRRLRGIVQSEASEISKGIRSPNFTLCSMPEMQLELGLCARVITSSDTPQPPLPGASAVPAPPLPVPGSCMMRLWGPLGLQLTFRITLGDGPSAVSRRFEHTFGAVPEGFMGEDQRGFFQVMNFCQLDQVWVRAEDTVQVSFEVLEFKMLPMMSHYGPSTLLTDSPAIEEDLRGDSEGTLASTADSDGMLFTRLNTTEVLMQERLQRDLVSLKNRMVRRVEWRLEGCSRMLEFCGTGQGFDSPIFSAAGIERIQFHFYPRGHDADKPGERQACGLFLSGPGKGVTLKAMLWVGGNNRQMEHRFQRRGDMGGRPRFCPLENQLDCEDSVLIAMDIQEVEQELPDHGASSILRDSRPNALEGSSVSRMNGGSSTTAPAPTGVKGLVRMKREDPSKTEELVKCVSLPTLNARTLSQMSMGLSSKSRRSFDNF